METFHMHFSQEERPFVQTVEKTIARVAERDLTHLTDFLDPRQLQIVRGLTNRHPDVQFVSFGGYPDAERCRGLMLPAYQTAEDWDWELSVVRISPESSGTVLTHGDYLGALTGLGVKRSKYGDISITDTCADIILTTEMSGFVLLNLTHVARAKVRTAEVALSSFTPPAVDFEERTFTVASPRLDAVLSDAMRLSRAKVLDPIRAGKVQVNWRQVSDPSWQLAEGDVVSMRGFGRFRILEMEGVSKKGRLFVKIGKYM
ncbi:MAG: hypothetical protein JWN30_1202 [Bacilli bacterium]|nr:hypothetical protein [Bacilli bacterium]